jgi:cupin domain
MHLHYDSDDVKWRPERKFTLKIGDEVTVGGPGTCACMPRGVPHAWKNTGPETGRALFMYTPAGAGKVFEDMSHMQRALSSMNDDEIAALFKGYRWGRTAAILRWGGLPKALRQPWHEALHRIGA